MPSCDNKERTKYFGTENWVRGIEEGRKHIRSFDNKHKLQNRKIWSINDSIASLSMTIFLVLPLLIHGLAEASENNETPTSSMEDQLEHLHLIPSDLPSDLYSPEDGEDLEEEDASLYYNLEYPNDSEDAPYAPRQQRASSMYLRNGKRAGNMYLRSGRASSMLLRAGKRSIQSSANVEAFDDGEDTALDEKTKRAQSMLLRAGKRGNSMLLRAGKRGNSMLLRAGKRAGGTMYLRAGKRSDVIDDHLCFYIDCSFQNFKRAGNSMLLRAGKRAKGNMYLRAGKRSNPVAMKKAGSMYLRAGKRSLDADAGKRAGNSMLLRAGKRAIDSMYLRSGK